MKDMRMLFSARYAAHVERAHRKLLAAGVPCEIRQYTCNPAQGPAICYPELWIEPNTDYRTASILYASPLRILKQRAESFGAG